MRRRRRGSEVGEVLLLLPAARLFVKTVFSVLAFAFLLSTAVLIVEFRDHWREMIFAHSHQFFFFPVLGLAALAAFFHPAVVLTDLYWRGILPVGKLRYWLGFAVVATGAALVAMSYAGTLGSALPRPAFMKDWTLEARDSRRAIWELSPTVLGRNMAEGSVVVRGCVTADGRQCRQLPLLTSLMDLRQQAMSRWTITEFARVCQPDPLVEIPAATWIDRHCFPAGMKLNAVECCTVQASAQATLSRLWSDPGNRSRLAAVEAVVTGFKSFFVIVVIVVGGMLAIWRGRLLEHYRGHLDGIERGVIVGAGLMLVWLLMDYGYQQTSDVLFGRQLRGFPVRASLAIGIMALFLIVYFLKRVDDRVFNLAQLSTIGASIFAVFNYELIGNTSARLLGSGASLVTFGFLILLAGGAYQLVHGRKKLPLPRMRGSSQGPPIS